MKNVKNILTFDCSNSSIRTILGKYDGSSIQTQVIKQQPNEMICVQGLYFWDILNIYNAMLQGLSKVARETEQIDSMGICTWGVDFALYSREGIMLANPLSYRNGFGLELLEEVPPKQQSELFDETGISCDKINSIYMLKAIKRYMPSLLQAADKLLLIPDILNYMFTGIMQNEPSELSTTQLIDVRTKSVSRKAYQTAELKEGLLSQQGIHGQKIGNILPQICRQIGINYRIPVVCVPSHDTASAVLALPAEEKDFAFISSGTWALIGTELDKPHINREVEQCHLSNEIGAFGKITLLKNHAGMFILQKLKEEYGKPLNWETFNSMGESFRGKNLFFDVNAPEFFNPEHMGTAIWDYLYKTGQTGPEFDFLAAVNSFLVSMACSYHQTLTELETVCGRSFENLYIVGGGVKNTRLCQLAADCTGKRVITGSSESTGIGSIAAQIRYFEPEKSIQDIRKIIKNSIKTTVYDSRGGAKSMLEQYKALTGKR